MTGATANATLGKWGNSQGVRIPKDVCELLNLKIGAPVLMEVNQATSQVTLTFEKPSCHYRRTKKVSLEELCAGWTGGKIGEEWGGADVGAEVVE
jgi:antitoxin component of MazEF toxin-antitoxin module